MFFLLLLLFRLLHLGGLERRGHWISENVILDGFQIL